MLSTSTPSTGLLPSTGLFRLLQARLPQVFVRLLQARLLQDLSLSSSLLVLSCLLQVRSVFVRSSGREYTRHRGLGTISEADEVTTSILKPLLNQ